MNPIKWSPKSLIALAWDARQVQEFPCHVSPPTATLVESFRAAIALLCMGFKFLTSIGFVRLD